MMHCSGCNVFAAADKIDQEYLLSNGFPEGSNRRLVYHLSRLPFCPVLSFLVSECQLFSEMTSGQE